MNCNICGQSLLKVTLPGHMETQHDNLWSRFIDQVLLVEHNKVVYNAGFSTIRILWFPVPGGNRPHRHSMEPPVPFPRACHPVPGKDFYSVGGALPPMQTLRYAGESMCNDAPGLQVLLENDSTEIATQDRRGLYPGAQNKMLGVWQGTTTGGGV